MGGMQIHENQLAVLGEAKAVEFEGRLVQFLREKVAAQRGREVLESDVRAHIAEARAWELDTERQIAAYVLGVWVFGGEFLALIEPMRASFVDLCVAPDTKARMLLEAFDSLWLTRSA
jgi:hypothetical protein